MSTEQYAVEATNLHKEYEGFTAVDDISFSVSKGEVVGIVGPNGAGKTTTLKMLAGLLEPTSGVISVAGEKPGTPEMARKLGFCTEESPVYDSMTAVEYLKFNAELYSVPEDVAEERLHSILDRLDLQERDKKIGNMSKGMTRKVVIARALINDPEVIIFDEPASGLDPYTTNYIIKFISELADEGKAIIMSAHNLYHVEDLCDRVIVVENGDVLANGTVAELRRKYQRDQFVVVADVDIGQGQQLSATEYEYRVDSSDGVDELREQISDAGGTVQNVRQVEQSLEDVFLGMIDVDIKQ